MALDTQLLGRGECEVNSGGVADCPAELVLTLVVVGEVGRLRLGHAAREVSPLMPYFTSCAPLPVVVERIPGPYLLDRDPVPTSGVDRVDGNLARPIPKLEPAVRQSDLVPGEPVVVGRVDLAAQPPRPVGRDHITGRRGLRRFLALPSELRIHPLT